MRKLLCFSAMALSGAQALTGPLHAQDLSHISEEEYVIGASLLTLFHEVGHAFVDRYQIPILAAEEEAVDAFAVLEMLEMQGLFAVTPALQATYANWWAASLDAWVRGAVDRGPLSFNDFQGDHPVDEQRLFDQVCLMYGADGEAYGAFADGYGLEADYAEDCGDLYDVTFNSWIQVLENADALETETDEEDDIAFVFEEPENAGLKRFRALFEGAEVLGHVQGYLTSTYVLDTPLTVRFLSCGEDNAFYNPETGEIEMCYELMAGYAIYHRGE